MQVNFRKTVQKEQGLFGTQPGCTGLLSVYTRWGRGRSPFTIKKALKDGNGGSSLGAV